MVSKDLTFNPGGGEKELRFPVETEDGSWEVRTYPIQTAPSRVHEAHSSDGQS